MKKVYILCFLAGALCACDLHDKIMNVNFTNQSETSVNDYIQPATTEDYIFPESDSDYIQYTSKSDYVMPVQTVYKDNKVQEKKQISIKEPQSVIEDKKPEPQPKKQVVIQQSEPDDTLLVPAKIAKTQPKPVIVKPDTDEIVVEKGDTVYSLSKKHNIVLRDLIDANNLRAPFSIFVGQKLKTPDKRIHVVAAGETLYSISRRYSVDLNSLAIENKITAPYSLSVGQKLRLPAQVQVSSAAMIAPSAPVAPVKSSVKIEQPIIKPVKTDKKTSPIVQDKTPKPKLITEKQKVSSAPAKPLPKVITQRKISFAWPVRGKILSNFGYKKNGLYNDGINIGAALGTAVKASETGVVAYAGNELKGMGNLIIIQHANGWMTVYAHLDTMSVRRGVKVAIGEKIGTIGKTGKVSEPQLHFEIRKGTKAYNPRKELKK